VSGSRLKTILWEFKNQKLTPCQIDNSGIAKNWLQIVAFFAVYQSESRSPNFSSGKNSITISVSVWLKKLNIFEKAFRFTGKTSRGTFMFLTPSLGN
jgi:hypothetical protein